jgi:ankyrin repeat protein
VRFLLASPVGADPRAARNNNFTPLHSAAMQGHAAVCEILIGAGAEVNGAIIRTGAGDKGRGNGQGHMQYNRGST